MEASALNWFGLAIHTANWRSRLQGWLAQATRRPPKISQILASSHELHCRRERTSLSNAAIHSAGGTKSVLPSVVMRVTKSLTVFFTGPSLHEGRDRPQLSPHPVSLRLKRSPERILKVLVLISCAFSNSARRREKPRCGIDFSQSFPSSRLLPNTPVRDPQLKLLELKSKIKFEAPESWGSCV
jgi:hypothetical protein